MNARHWRENVLVAADTLQQDSGYRPDYILNDLAGGYGVIKTIVGGFYSMGLFFLPLMILLFILFPSLSGWTFR